MQLDPIEQLYKLSCRESSFRTTLYKLDPVLFRRFTTCLCCIRRSHGTRTADHTNAYKRKSKENQVRDTILCLCDLTGTMARPWVENGYKAVLVDPQHGIDHEDGAYLKLARTIEEAFAQISVLVRSGRLAFVAGFPPCTDMAVSGAQWFARKYEADHMFQAKAVSVAEQCRVIGEMSGVPYMVENPVSVLSNVFGKPSYTFNPCDYTRFAPEDNYTKKTCLWTGGIPNAASQPGHDSSSR